MVIIGVIRVNSIQFCRCQIVGEINLVPWRSITFKWCAAFNARETHTHTQTAKSVTWSSAVRPTNKMTFLCFFWTSHSRCFQCFSFSSCFSWLAHIIEVIPSTGDHRKLGEMESKWLVCSACFKTKPTHCHSSQSPTSIDHQYHQNLPNWLVVSTHLNNSR